jgi:hypothetical protein
MGTQMRPAPRFRQSVPAHRGLPLSLDDLWGLGPGRLEHQSGCRVRGWGNRGKWGKSLRAPIWSVDNGVSAEQGGQERIGAVGSKAIARDEVAAASVRVERARRIAERGLQGSLEVSGTPVIFHVRRVAEASPVFARSVAWLHDVLEDASVSEEELLASGLTDDELRALRLLTRDRESRSVKHYLCHISHIARSSGSAGEIARAVKRADLADRQRHPNRRADGWHPPYQAALALLDEDRSELRSAPTLDLTAGRQSVGRENLHRAGSQGPLDAPIPN